MTDERGHIGARIDGTLARIAPLSSSFGFRLAAQSLRQVRSDLHDSARPSLEILLDGAPVVGHEVRVDALARLLTSLQESVSSVAQALAGKITTRSSIPGPLREVTALRLAATFEGSFGAILRGPEPLQRELPGLEDAEDLLDLSISKVLDIIGLAGNENLDDDPIVDAVLPLGARSFKHLSDLSRVVSETGMSASVSWKNVATDARRATFSKPVAARLGDVLARNQVTEDVDDVVGRLGTVSDIRNRIELETDDGRVLTASVIEELVPQLGRYFTHHVTASFEITRARSIVTGTERTSYRLVGLAMNESGETDSVPRLV